MTILPAALAVGIIRLAGLVHRPTPPPSSPAAGWCRIVPTAVPVLAVLSAWSTFNAIAETSTYTNHKADNSIEARIASARDQASGWEAFLDDQREGDLHIAAWGNGRGRGWANGGGGGGGFANARGGGWGNGGGGFANARYGGGFVNW